ncbi:saccharopine dehydrogenase family protein [Gordonia phthalatica]|uniref:Saccharopine dehydrogenase n=1 Tax=Gordonia phthalatica TaxID=1136941 RepID=A0A0N9N9H1_9ACTN|nr:saccharopine dehydrogenase NADP-binding domain-containing protein [Gordonia phthalatica]ALG84886.1 saccharopine dehydrogenase [Gordonia phthalatica]
MADRIVVFGATGYAGGLAVEALVRRGVGPVLAGRSERRLADVAASYGGLDIAVADVADPQSVRSLVGEGDVLVTGVGPFGRVGWAAAEAAASVGAHYVDSTGEVGFVQDLERRLDGPARGSGSVMLPAFGYDYIPGMLAGDLAATDAGPAARSIDVGYFASGPLWRGLSQGTRRTLVDGMTLPVAAYEKGELVDVRAGRSVSSMPVGGARKTAVLATGTEVLQLPRLHPNLTDVHVFNGWFPRLARPMQAMALASSLLGRTEVGRRGLTAMLSSIAGSPGGPDEAEWARIVGRAVAVARAADGTVLAEVEVQGPSPYTVTADLMASAAIRLAAGGGVRPGVVGPVDGLGREGFRAVCEEVGLVRRYSRT